MKTYFGFLNESRNIGTLYHILDPNKLLYVLKNNVISSYYFPRISTTRDKMMSGYVGDKPSSFFKLELDGNKLSQKYKIKPFTYVSITNIRFDESEEQIQTNKIENALSYVKKIILMKNRVDRLLDSGWFDSDGAYFKSGRINLPELLKMVIDKLKENDFELWVQKGNVIEKDDKYINSILNKSIKKVYHGYAYYLRGYVEGKKHGLNILLDKVIPINSKNREIKKLVIGYEYENLNLLKNKNSLDIDSIEIPKDFKLYCFDFEYETKDIIDGDEKEFYIKKSTLKNIEIIK